MAALLTGGMLLAMPVAGMAQAVPQFPSTFQTRPGIVRVSQPAVVQISQSAEVRQAPITGQIQQSRPVIQNTVTSLAEPALSPQQLVSKLLTANNLDPKIVRSVQILESNDLNAATNGSDIVVTSALWNRLRTNDQRAFVLGHELSHVVLSHVGKTQVRRVGLGLLDRFLLNRYISSGSILDVASNVGLDLLDKKYSRNFEYQADDLGMQLLVNAGYQPRAALDVFNTLKAASGSSMPEFLQNHPISDSRIQALVNKYQLAND